MDMALLRPQDLLVALKGLERAIFGSVCDKVVRFAPCPVLTINPALG